MGYNSPTNTYDTIEDLRLAIGQASSSVTLVGAFSISDGLGGTFYWISDSTDPDDDFNIIQPLNIPIGRWIRLNQGSIKTGSFSRSGNGSTTNFSLVHTMPTPYTCLITPKSVDAAAPYYISSEVSGLITITFISAPPSGTNNISFNYVILNKIN